METGKPLVDNDYQLQKFDCKGGWTFIELPEIPMPKTSFGMLKVKGKIDDYELSNYNLMPLGNGHLFLPVKATVRKNIKKEAPDTVHVTLYEDRAPLIIPEELLLCMKDEPGATENFDKYAEGQKRAFVNWINSAKTEQTRIDRIAKTITMVLNGEKLY